MNTLLRVVVCFGLATVMGGLISCVSGNDTVVSASRGEGRQAVDPAPPPLDVELFSTEELFAAGGGGCGMTLLPKAGELPNASNPAGMLLFHGIDRPMLMKINQKFVEFELEQSQGDAFYGQRTQQTFRNRDLNLIVHIQVSLNGPGEIESSAIPNAAVQLQQDAGADTQKVDAIAVFGDAGC